jgi:hypothetical protein
MKIAAGIWRNSYKASKPKLVPRSETDDSFNFLLEHAATSPRLAYVARRMHSPT